MFVRGTGKLALAFDRKSVRRFDEDGRLHLAVANISKSNVCSYLGSEIPDWQGLGLSPDREYQLLRDPTELAKAASTFENIPILSCHVPVDVRDHRPDLVCGSSGTDAKFSDPFLQNSLVFWTSASIEAIENGSRRELSSAYRYELDLTPGNFRGVAFAGVMRNIIGNHIATVAEGRVGKDVVVGDTARHRFPTYAERFPHAAKIKVSA